MRSFVLTVTGGLLFGAAIVYAADTTPGIAGNWKLDAAKSDLDSTNKDFSLLIEKNDQTVHIKETRGPNAPEDVSEFTCDTMGRECAMRDGKEKATVSVYYNGPMLVVLKTHGRKGSVVEKQRFSLPDAANTLLLELMPIEPEGKTQKLVFTKSQ